jgi:ergothioneine biosynthesis protein EgtB
MQKKPSESGLDLLVALARSRALTDDLFRVVREDSLYQRPIPERHRIAFYLGHLEAFDWNLIGGHVLGLNSFHKEFDKLFAFGIDPVGGGLPTDQPSDWPARPEIERYNDRVRLTLDEALGKVSFSEPGQSLLREGYILNVAIEHRLMHAGTLAYMLHQLPWERKLPQAAVPAPDLSPPPEGMVEIPAGVATLGHVKDDGFGWDNEFEAHTVSVPRFAMDVHNVTNVQFLEFMNAGGYEDRIFWSPADWNWITSQGIDHPNFWFRQRDQWFYRGMFKGFPLPLNDPVYVSHAEAAAYARWKGKALPTEAQFHRAAYGTPDGAEREYPWGDGPPDAQHGNFDFQRWDPVPVGTFPAGTSAFGVADLVGNGWEWTSTIFAPFAGFKPFPFYTGYSANFFDGQHYVMKGGEARTAARLLRRSFRNWFQPHYAYVYAAFRCVEN